MSVKNTKHAECADEAMTAADEAKENVKKASPLKTAIVGLLIIVSSAAIVNLLCQTVDFLDRVKHPLYYYELIEQYSDEYEVPRAVICAVINTESSFVPDAVSPAGAMGLMQITPDTFFWLMSKTDEEYDVEKLLDPEINIKYGSYFLSVLYEDFGDWNTVYAAYNAGMNRVKGWLNDSDISEAGQLKNIPIKETRDYVKKVENDVRDYQRLYSASHFDQNG